MIELGSRSLRVVIDTARGGEIIYVGPPDGPNALFHEPWETPVPAGRSVSYGNGTLDWLSHYRGGWQVMFPNAGDACTVDGIPHPVHGEVASAPAVVVEAGREHVILRSPTRLPIHLERRIRLVDDEPVLLIEERIENEADRPFEYAWGHHPAFAATANVRIDLPIGPVHYDGLAGGHEPDVGSGTWPEVVRPNGVTEVLDRVTGPAVERVCMLPDRPAGWAALREPATGRGVALAWDTLTFPHLWLWVQIGGVEFPWYGRARIVALEPVSIWPGDGLARAIERGRASTLEPRASASSWATVSLFPATSAPVTGVSRNGQVLTTAANGST